MLILLMILIQKVLIYFDENEIRLMVLMILLFDDCKIR